MQILVVYMVLIEFLLNFFIQVPVFMWSILKCSMTRIQLTYLAHFSWYRTTVHEGVMSTIHNGHVQIYVFDWSEKIQRGVSMNFVHVANTEISDIAKLRQRSYFKAIALIEELLLIAIQRFSIAIQRFSNIPAVPLIYSHSVLVWASPSLD